MCKIVIIDDDVLQRDELSVKLKELFPQHTVKSCDVAHIDEAHCDTYQDIDIVFFNSLKETGEKDSLDVVKFLRSHNPKCMLIYLFPESVPAIRPDVYMRIAEVGIDGAMRYPAANDDIIKGVVTNALKRLRVLEEVMRKDREEIASYVVNFANKLDKVVDTFIEENKRKRKLSFFK